MSTGRVKVELRLIGAWDGLRGGVGREMEG